jgi:hypothetical protein
VSCKWLPDKDAAIEVDAEAEEGLDVAPVAVSVALQALQQDPATHANQSIHLAGRQTTIHQYTCKAARKLSINPTEQVAPQPLINPSVRLPHNYQSIHLAGRHTTYIN